MNGSNAAACARLRAAVRISDGRMQGLPAPAKLNLFLHVVGRRADGLHELQTVFRFIDLSDTLDLSLRADGRIERSQGMAGLDPEQDLTVRAARALQQASGCTQGATIAVNKRIPAGGGLGGGSSDAATVLLALNRLWGLGLTRAQLQAIGLSLGADVPVFVGGRNAFAEGIGEQLSPVDLPDARYLLVHPGVSVPTATIFTDPGLTRNTPPVKITSFSAAVQAQRACAPVGGAADGSVDGIIEFGHNDLERVATRRFRQVEDALAWLSELGLSTGTRPRMSGSGGCCFLPVQTSFIAPAPPPGMTAWLVDGLVEHPLLALWPD